MTLVELALVSAVTQLTLLIAATYSCDAMVELLMALQARNDLMRDAFMLKFMITVFMMLVLLYNNQLTVLRLLGYDL